MYLTGLFLIELPLPFVKTFFHFSYKLMVLKNQICMTGGNIKVSFIHCQLVRFFTTYKKKIITTVELRLFYFIYRNAVL